MRSFPSSFRFRVVPVLVLLAAAPAATAQQRMSPELLWQLGRVADPQISVDGSRLLYSVRRYDLAANSGRSQVYLMDLRTRKSQQLTEAGSNSSARWSPTGAEQIAFVSSRSGAAQIHVMDLGSRHVRRVTSHPGGVSNVAWSPTGEHFSFTAEVKMDPDVASMFPDLPKAKARIYDDLMIRHWDGWNEGTYSHLFVVAASGRSKPRDLLAGKRVDTPLKPFGGGEQICWSPDGKRLCYTAKVVDAPEVSTDSSLFVVGLDGADHRNITVGRPGYDTEPAWSPDGRHIAFLSMQRAGFEADRNRIMLLEVASGKLRELSVGFDQTASGLTWTSGGDGLLFLSDAQGTHQLYRIGLDRKVVALSAGRYHFGSPVIGPKGAVYCTRMQMERPNEIVRLDGKPATSASGGGVALTDVNGPIYARLSLPTTEERWHLASDGQKIHSWVIYPPGFDRSKKYPMLLYCQGGPQSQVGQWFSFRWNFHLMAAQGYIVLAVNRRGLPGFGQAWNDQISRDWGGQAMRDLLSATDAMHKEPYVDRDKTGAIGASFGGYTIYWLMGHDQEDRFKTMIAHCGVFNLESMYLSTEELFFVNWDLGGPFWRSPEVAKDYQRFSPHQFIGNWQTPLLVVHGQRDFRVPVEQGIQAFTAAQLQGVPSRFLYFPDEGHWVLSPQNGVLWHRVFFDWLGRSLKK